METLKELWEQAQELMGLRQRDFQQDLQWSIEAQKILAEPLVQRFFEETEKSLVEQWQNTKPDAVEQREVAYQFLILTRKFKSYFETFLANEQYALQQLQEMDKEV